MTSEEDGIDRDPLPYEANRAAWEQAIAGPPAGGEAQRVRWKHLHFEAFMGPLETLVRVRAAGYLEEFRHQTRFGAYAQLLHAMGDADPNRPPNIFGVVDALGLMGWELAALHYTEDSYVYCVFKAPL